MSRGLRSSSSRALGLVLAAAIVLTGLAGMDLGPDRARPPSALWWVVHDLCVPDQRLFGLPAPCRVVNLRQGWALVKDDRAPPRLLIVPTRRISGIESPALLAPNAPNYWQFAWNTRGVLARHAGREIPRQDVALVINSRQGRTQNQLHIHLGCVAPAVAATLAARLGEIGESWRPLSVPLAGHRVLARRLEGADFEGRDPFKLLAAGVPGARSDMGEEALSVVGMVFSPGRPGFILLSHPFPPDAADVGAGEEILDRRCAILSSPMGPEPSHSAAKRKPEALPRLSPYDG